MVLHNTTTNFLSRIPNTLPYGRRSRPEAAKPPQRIAAQTWLPPMSPTMNPAVDFFRLRSLSNNSDETVLNKNCAPEWPEEDLFARSFDIPSRNIEGIPVT